jgi:hypothetical protein
MFCNNIDIKMPNEHLKPWQEHLAKYRQMHPKLSLKEAMKGASESWGQKGKGKKQKEIHVVQEPVKLKGKGRFNKPIGTVSEFKILPQPSKAADLLRNKLK